MATRHRRAFLLCAACALCGGGGAESGGSADTSAAWRMRPVRSFQARVETDAPLWDADHKVFVSGHDPSNEQLTFEERYENTLDSVTTSSVEGALMYLQRDCIDVGADPVAAGCKRRNDIKVITFMEITIAQPFDALSFYQADRNIYPEFCPFVTMRNGQCVAVEDDDNDGEDEDDDTDAHPRNCQLYNGLDASRPSWKIGPCVGAHAYPTDIVAPYPNAVWFSYPNSCVMNTWAEGKSAACRETYKGGLCPFGVEPDGVRCMFAYKILGYLSIDELVGIVETDWSSGSGSAASFSADDDADDAGDDDDETRRRLAAESYDDYEDFCEAKQIELHAFGTDNTLGLKSVTAIPFWRNPSDVDANVARTNAMIAMYNAFVANEQANVGNRMQPLPTNLTALMDANPPCYQNAKLCYDAKFGCARHSYAQVCSVCREPRENCVARVPSYNFPSLKEAPTANASSSSSSSSSSASSKAATSGGTASKSARSLRRDELAVSEHERACHRHGAMRRLGRRVRLRRVRHGVGRVRTLLAVRRRHREHGADVVALHFAVRHLGRDRHDVREARRVAAVRGRRHDGRDGRAAARFGRVGVERGDLRDLRARALGGRHGAVVLLHERREEKDQQRHGSAQSRRHGGWWRLLLFAGGGGANAGVRSLMRVVVGAVLR